jgi:hypothetical protein
MIRGIILPVISRAGFAIVLSGRGCACFAATLARAGAGANSDIAWCRPLHEELSRRRRPAGHRPHLDSAWQKPYMEGVRRTGWSPEPAAEITEDDA